MNKKYEINIEQNKRQIELLEKYFTLDKERKTVIVFLKYSKASEIFENSIGNKLYARISHETLEKINSIIENIPNGYQTDINFEIEDFEGYNPKEIIESFNDTLELDQYAIRKYRQKKELISSILIFIGIILLFIMIVGKNEKWFGNDIKEEIITEIIDISAWVFIWEAVTALFLEHSEKAKFALKIRRKVSQIAVFNKNEEKAIALEKANTVFGKWENEGTLKRIGKLSLLISSLSFVFIAIYAIYDFYRIINKDLVTSNSLWLYSLIFLISTLISLFAGIGGISRYLGKNGKLSKFVGLYAASMLIVFVINLIFYILTGNASSIFMIATSFIFNIMYIFGYYVDKYIK